jgi:nicotinate phosphoribosyltransferase
VEFDGQPRVKLSQEKASYPCRKQVFRSARNNTYTGDMIGLAEEASEGEPLLNCVMRDGKRLQPALPLDQIREHAAQALKSVPAEVRALERPAHYPVRLSRRLEEVWEMLRSNREDLALSKAENR